MIPRSLNRLVDIGTLVCAVVLTGLVLRRELRPTLPSPARDEAVADWDRVRTAGHRFGPLNPAVTIVEFSDFQCPYCARFARQVLPAVRRKHGDDVAVIYRHWPLSIHTYAADAAVAAECAAEQRRFEAFHDALFANQDSIGSWSFDLFAKVAGVPSPKAFADCRVSEKTRAIVERDRKMALELGARGTPTFIVNGVKLAGSLDEARIDSFVRAARR